MRPEPDPAEVLDLPIRKDLLPREQLASDKWVTDRRASAGVDGKRRSCISDAVHRPRGVRLLFDAGVFEPASLRPGIPHPDIHPDRHRVPAGR